MQVTAPLVSLCMLAEPVDFGSTDGMPVHTLFVLVTPSVRVHLHVLSLLSAALHDPVIRAKLEARVPPGELLAEIERLEADQLRAREERLARSDRP
jgi:PTS system nitrogen regulatory IIA component